MAEWAITHIAETLGASESLSHPKQMVNRLLIDSRQFSLAEGTLFFALRGHNHDGHNYIHELYQKGVRNFVVEEIPAQLDGQANFLVVRNTLAALQKLGRGVRQKSSSRVLAITGSNGKTVVKEWLSQLLQNDVPHVRSPKSFNSQLGVPLSLWRIQPEHKLAIIEAGISKPGEMAGLQEMIKPNLGIFTNIASAHGENFKSEQQKIEEKLKLFFQSQNLVYQQNQSLLSEEIQAFAKNHNIGLLSWSIQNTEADLFLEKDNDNWRAYYKGENSEFNLPFADEASLQNAFHAFRAALELGLALPVAAKRLANLQPVEMRLEMKMGINDNLIIDDAYNSDLESLRLALHFLTYHGKNRDKALIISDVMQTGLVPEELNSKIEAMVNSADIQKVIAIGPRLKQYAPAFTAPAVFYSSTEDFLRDLPRHSFQNWALLLKGARVFRFEKISQRLEKKSHETVLKINLNRLVHNLNYFRNLLSPNVRTMAMVKAYAYGSGAFEVANVLQFHGVDYLGVAYADEGVELRKAGISLPILVLNPERNALHELVHFQLEPEIYNITRLREFAAVVSELAPDQPFPVHLKLETGMNRLGFTEEQLEELVATLQLLPQIKVASVFSHLAAADEADEEDFTRQQIDRFEQMSSWLRQHVKDDFWRHLANSAAITKFPEAHFDMVRLGISLYGVAARQEDQQHLQVVSQLEATVSQLKKLKPGDTVSYGRTFKASKAMTLAIISIGYADGFRRSLSNGAADVAIRGKRYPTVGRVCMDMIMVDVTDSPVQEGDMVEIFGDTITVQELADRMRTIPYEVFTGISQRVKRIYFME